MLIFGRLIDGLATGLIYFATPMFLSEIAPYSRRGLFTGLHSQFVGLGYMTSNWIGFGVSYTTGQFAVRSHFRTSSKLRAFGC
jgi:MFS family permease